MSLINAAVVLDDPKIADASGIINLGPASEVFLTQAR
jgi:hypothetical protein